MSRGGYQRPRKPAPVSAPGALSRRTDGGPQQLTEKMTGLPYGENADFNEMQSAAPLRATPDAGARTRNKSQSTGGGSSPAPVGIFEPTRRPNEPVTAGAPFGPGMGPIRNAQRPRRSISDSMQLLADATGDPGLAGTAEFIRRLGR